MSFISSIQSFLPLPRPEKRSRAEIDRDLEDEIGFHLEMKTRSLMSQHAGVKREDASAVAKKKFGDVEAIKSQCRSIALKERIMLQRMNFGMMVVVVLMVIGVGAQVWITQRYNTLALQAITSDLANMKFEAATATRGDPGLVYVSGDVARPGVFNLPLSGNLTVSRLLVANGGMVGAAPHHAQVSRNMGNTIKVFSFDLSKNEGADFVLEPDDEIRFLSSQTVALGTSYFGLPEGLVGRWKQVDGTGAIVASGATLDLIGRKDVRNLRAVPTATLNIPARSRQFDLAFEGARTPNLEIYAPTEKRTLTHGRWEYRDDKLLLNITPAVPEITEPLAFVHVGEGDSAKPDTDARAKAVGDFVVRIFALADRNDANPSQTIRDFLDEEEKTIDGRYGNDPATAGMIRELIAARRKILDVDARVSVGEGMRLGVGAASSDPDARVRAVTEFLEDVLASADPHPKTLQMKDVLDNAEAKIATDFADNPEVAARLRDTIDKARQQMDAEKNAAPAATEPADDPGEVRQDDDHFPKLSPFRAVHWKDEWTPIVNYNEQWYELMSIDGLEARAIMEHCRQLHGEELARKRFSEDLGQMLIEMGRTLPENARVKLQIKDLRSGTMIAVGEALMNQENREEIVKDNAAAEGAYPLWQG